MRPLGLLQSSSGDLRFELLDTSFQDTHLHAQFDADVRPHDGPQLVMIACQHDPCRCIRVLQWNEDFLLHGLPGFIDQDIVLDLVDADALDLARTDAGGDRDVDVLDLLQLGLPETDLAVPE